MQLLDVLTGWSERLAILGHEFDEMWRAIQAFKEHCPIPVREIHTDNGSEFMNLAFVSHFGSEKVHDPTLPVVASVTRTTIASSSRRTVP